MMENVDPSNSTWSVTKTDLIQFNSIDARSTGSEAHSLKKITAVHRLSRLADGHLQKPIVLS